MPTRSLWLRVHAAVSIAVLATFARALPYPLQRSWDDGCFILDNPDVRGVSLAALRSIALAPHFEAYHPLHLLSYWLDVPWTDANPIAVHVTSLVLYVVAGNLLVRLFAELGFTPAATGLACAACLLHPIQVEVVSWATGRKDVLALLFASACTLSHLRAQRFLDPAAWWARLFYVLAILSKTTALPLPFVLFWLDVCLARRSARAAIRLQLPSLALGAITSVYVVHLWQGEQMIRQGPGWFERVAATVTHQLTTALWPSATSPMYSTRLAAGPAAWMLMIALLALGTVVLARRARRITVARREGGIAFALGTFALLFAPVANAVPMYFPLQDRYLSLPLLGLGFALVLALDALAPHVRRVGLALAMLAVLALALRTLQYEGEWRAETRLWGHAASTQPDAYYAFVKLGEVRRDAADFSGSIRAYARAIALEPERKLSHAALFQTVAMRDEHLRHLPAASETYTRAYYAALEDPDALRELATRLLERGYLRAPELPLERALAVQSFPDAAFERAAAAQFAEGRPSLALFYLRHMKRASRDPALSAAAERARRELANAPTL